MSAAKPNQIMTNTPIILEYNSTTFKYCLRAPLTKTYEKLTKYVGIDFSLGNNQESIINITSIAPEFSSNQSPYNFCDPNSPTHIEACEFTQYKEHFFHFFACVMVWDTIFCLIIHLFVTLLSLGSLYRHQFGRWYSLIIFFSSIFHPIGVGVVSSLISVSFLTELSNYWMDDLAGPVMSMLIGMFLNFLMVASALFFQRFMRFV